MLVKLEAWATGLTLSEASREAAVHKTTESLRREGIAGDYLVQAPTQSGVSKSRLLRAIYSWIFNISMDHTLVIITLLPQEFSQFSATSLFIFPSCTLSVCYENVTRDGVKRHNKAKINNIHWFFPHLVSLMIHCRRLLDRCSMTSPSLNHAGCSKSPVRT